MLHEWSPESLLRWISFHPSSGNSGTNGAALSVAYGAYVVIQNSVFVGEDRGGGHEAGHLRSEG